MIPTPYTRAIWNAIGHAEQAHKQLERARGIAPDAEAIAAIDSALGDGFDDFVLMLTEEVGRHGG